MVVIGGFYWFLVVFIGFSGFSANNAKHIMHIWIPYGQGNIWAVSDGQQMYIGGGYWWFLLVFIVFFIGF